MTTTSRHETPLDVIAEAALSQDAQRQSDLFKTTALQTTIFNSANFCSIATDARGVIQIFNVGAERLLGYTAAEVVNKLTLADFHDAQELIARAVALSLEFQTDIAPGFEAIGFLALRGIEDTYELTKVRKDGSRFPALVSVTALRDPDDAVIGYLLIGTDNTASTQAYRYARSLLEASLDPLVTISPEGKITDVNEGSVKVTGVSREKLIGTDFSNYFTEPEKASQGYQQVFADGFVTDYPLTILHQGGRLTDVLYNASVYKDVHGRVLGVFAAARDITARKQAEEALLKAGALQSAIFNSANFSSIATDANGVIQIFNVGAERMLGYTAAEVMNKITPADISDPQEVIARATALSVELGTAIAPGFEALVFKASRGIEDIYELTYIRKDGSRFPAVVSVTALRDAQNAIIGYLLIGTDNTARKQVEAERQRLDRVLRETNLELQGAKVEAERANLAKSDFLSRMSHELRSPLNAILGFAQLIDSGSPLPTPDQKESTDQILQAGWYLLELINEILDLAQIESGKLSLSTEPISLDEVLSDCQAMVEPQARKSGIRVGFPKSEHPLFVSADRTRLKQIFVNLLSNAIKYNRVGGSVEVTCRACPGDRVRVSFEDTGEGLAPGKLAQLFQPFNRLGQEDGLEEGTGIGLVVSKQLAELMEGSIGVESTVGVGSVFWVEFNATVAIEAHPGASAPAPAVPVDAASAAPPRTVLCVEDNPANLMLITRILARRPDIRLLSANDGRQGIEMARTAMPEVILMDINLPGINGVAALKILAADAATSHIPVIAISANAMPRDIERGLEAGFFRYLTKPIKVDEFMDTLDLALECARARSEVGKGEQTVQ
jgi:PAS domain S-box-containing protein